MSKLTATEGWSKSSIYYLYQFIYYNSENVKNNIQIEDYNNTNLHSNEMQHRVWWLNTSPFS